MMKNVYVGWGPVGLTKISSNKQKLELNQSNITLELNSEFQIVINSEYEETPVWKSSNENVATVDQNGNVTVKGYGTAYITVTSGNKTGVCTIKVPEDLSNQLDNTKIYYGTIKSPSFMMFSDLTKEIVTQAIQNGTIKISDLTAFNAQVTIENGGDCIVVLIPSSEYKALQGMNKVSFEPIDGYEGSASNGEVKLEDFYIYGEFSEVPGTLEIYVE